jgi:ankyrin repeat protein
MSIAEAATSLRDGDTSLFGALSEDQLKQLATQKDEDGRSCLHTAAAHGHAQLCAQLAVMNPQAVNAVDEGGWTPLLSAASSGHEQVVHCLLSHGADVHTAPPNGRTALHYAASKSHDEVVQVLQCQQVGTPAHITHGPRVSRWSMAPALQLQRIDLLPQVQR